MAKDGLLERETGLSAVTQQLEGLPVPDRLFGRAAAIYDPGRKAGELCPASGIAGVHVTGGRGCLVSGLRVNRGKPGR